jgi:anti-anti-sigma regulatory factor
MTVTQRQVVLGLLSVMVVGSAALLLAQLASGGPLLYLAGAAASSAAFGALLAAYWRGWYQARYVAVVLMTLLVALLIQEPFLTQVSTLSIIIPPILALILAEPAWVAGSAAVIYVTLLVRAGGQGVYTDPTTIAIYLMSVAGMILARFVTDTAQRLVRQHAQEVESARRQAELQAHELAEANDLMAKQLDQQQQLLQLVTTLETPVVPLADGMLLAPIVGHIDTRRAQALTERLLATVSAYRARLIVLDIAGVAVMDTAVARSLLQAVQALRLLGCEVVVSGISASTAMSLIHLGVNLEDVRAVRSPQDALVQFIRSAASPGQSERSPEPARRLMPGGPSN